MFLWTMFTEAKKANDGGLRPNLQLADGLQYLNKRQRLWFLVKLTMYSVPNSWSQVTTYKVVEIKRVAREMRTTYADALSNLVASLGYEPFMVEVERRFREKGVSDDSSREILAIASGLAGKASDREKTTSR